MLLEKRQFVNCFIKLLDANNKQHLEASKKLGHYISPPSSSATDAKASFEPVFAYACVRQGIYEHLFLQD